MRRHSVITVHVALTLLPLASMGLVGWRWLGNGEGARALERTHAEQQEVEQRVRMLHRALNEAPVSAPVGTVTLPERQNLADTLEAIEGAAQQAGIASIRTVTQRTSTPGRQSLEIQGETARAQQLTSFLARLEGGSRVLVIHQVEVRADAQGRLAFTLQVAAYHRTNGER